MLLQKSDTSHRRRHQEGIKLPFSPQTPLFTPNTSSHPQNTPLCPQHPFTPLSLQTPQYTPFVPQTPIIPQTPFSPPSTPLYPNTPSTSKQPFSPTYTPKHLFNPNTPLYPNAPLPQYNQTHFYAPQTPLFRLQTNFWEQRGPYLSPHGLERPVSEIHSPFPLTLTFTRDAL